MWSAQAILINKRAVKVLINEIVSCNSSIGVHITLKHPENRQFLPITYRLVVDTYLYDMFQPTYTHAIPC